MNQHSGTAPELGGDAMHWTLRRTKVVGSYVPSCKLPTRETTLATLLMVLATVAFGCQFANSTILGLRTEMPVLLASQPGWLYVLDSRKHFEKGQILIVNPVNMEVADRIPTGFRPDFALSPDGSRLFVTSREAPGGADILVMIDTTTKVVLDKQVLSNLLMYTVSPLRPTMVVSPDGRWLFIGKNHWTAADEQQNAPPKNEYALAVYDIQDRSLAKADIPISNDCLGMATIASRTELYVICSAENQILSFPFTSSGLGQRRVFTLPPGPKQVFDDSLTTADKTRVHPYIAGIVFSPDGGTMTVFTTYMRAIRFDLATGNIVHAQQVRDNRWAMPANIIRSPDATRVYVATGLLSRVNMAPGVDEILILDAATLSEIDAIHTTGPFRSLTISKDGEYLYAVDFLSQTLYMIEARTGREVQKIAGVGAGPSRVAVVPSAN